MAPAQAPSDKYRRSEAEVRDAVLAATSAMLRETGLSRLTMEGVASRAGVAKTTVYRQWSTREILVVDAFVSVMQPDLAMAETGCAEADIRSHLTGFAEVCAGDHGPSVRDATAAAALDAVAAWVLAQRYVVARRCVLVQAIRRGVRDGAFRPDLDEEAVVDALLGPILFRTAFRHATMDAGWVGAVVDAVFRGCRAAA